MSKMSDKHLREEVIPKLEEQERELNSNQKSNEYIDKVLDVQEEDFKPIQERNKTVISDEDDAFGLILSDSGSDDDEDEDDF